MLGAVLLDPKTGRPEGDELGRRAAHAVRARLGDSASGREILRLLDRSADEPGPRAADPYTNFSYSTVQAGSTVIGSTGTGVTVLLPTGDGAFFPGGDGTTQFNVVCWPANTRPLARNAEIIRCTRSGDVLTVVGRAQEGSTVRANIAATDQVMAAVTAKTISDLDSIFYRKLTSTAATNTITETDLLNGEVVIAANRLSTNRTMRITMLGDAVYNAGSSQNSPVFKLKLGAGPTIVIATPAGLNLMTNSAVRGAWRALVEVVNLGVANLQSVTVKIEMFVAGQANTNPITTVLTTGEGYQIAIGSSLHMLGYNTAAIDTTSAMPVLFTVTNPSATLCETKLVAADVEIL